MSTEPTKHPNAADDGSDTTNGNRTPINRDEVFAAAERLCARGARVSLTELRSELGNRGSFTTIRNYMNDWRKTRLAERVEVLAPEMKTLTDVTAATILKSLIPEISRHVAKAYDIEKAQNDRELKLALDDFDSAVNANEKLQEEIRTARKNIEDQQIKLSTALDDLNRSLSTVQTLKREIVDLGNTNLLVSEQLRLAQERGVDTERRLELVNQEIGKLRFSSEQSELEIKKLREENYKLEQSESTIHDRLIASEKEKEAVIIKFREWENRYKHETSEIIAKLEGQIALTEERIAKARAQEREQVTRELDIMAHRSRDIINAVQAIVSKAADGKIDS